MRSSVISRMKIQFLLMLLLAWQLASVSVNAADTAAEKSRPAETINNVSNKSLAVNKPQISFSQVDTFPNRLNSGELSIKDIPNPHWKNNACIACHTEMGSKANARNLRHASVEKICNNCHTAEFDHRYIHPSNVQLDKKTLANMDESMQSVLAQNNNTISCVTCHDLTLQCRTDNTQRQLTNSKFFRFGPHESRSQLCFLCHDENQYQRLNPHDQVDDQGQLITEKCSICHAGSIDELRQAKNIEQVEFHASDSLSSMCWGCHPWTPHPGGQFSFFKQDSGPNHLVKPSAWIKKRMDETSKQNHLLLPLEPGSGKVFCGTCHNPHEKGVIKNQLADTGADTPSRLRAQKICEYCHDK
jgi:hypothetical protein